MKKLQQIGIIISLLCVMIFGGGVGATDGELQVEIFYTIDPTANVSFISIGGVFTSVHEHLEEFNLDANFIPIDFSQRMNHNVAITFYALSDDAPKQVQIWMQFQNPSIERLSSILYSEYLLELNLSYENTVERLVALILYQTDMIEEAELVFQSYLPEPDGVPIDDYFYMANIKILQSDYEVALEYLHLTDSRGFYQSAQTTVNEAWILWRQGRIDDALRILDYHITYYIEELPSLAVLYISKRAQLYALAFDYDSAIADMNSAIELAEENELDNTTLAELYTLRGEIIFLIYEWDRVLDNFNHALELDPDYAPAYFQRGVLYYTMTQRELALDDFETYLELAPDGEYSEQAQDYIESIQIELDALEG